MAREPKNATILALDIRGFTSLCEKIPHRNVGRFIDEYFSIVRNALDKVAGAADEVIIDRFLGDGFLIFIFDDAKGPFKAVDASFEVIKTVGKKVRTEYNFTNIGVAAAVGKGEILYGKFGEECSRDSIVCPINWQGETTGIGASVNATFRMLNIAVKDEVLVSEDVRNIVREEYLWTELDAIYVKGVRQPVVPYSILRKGRWDENRHCSQCTHCANHKFCEVNYNFGKVTRSASVYIQEKWELPRLFPCDMRQNGKGEWCEGCEINRLTVEAAGQGCHLNYVRGIRGRLEERNCCPDCNRFFTCKFSLHRGKNHTPWNESQARRKRYCCEACVFFMEAESECVSKRMTA